MNNGYVIFATACSGCHGHLAEGKLGPALSDDYWTYPGNREDKGLFETIYGGADGQMGPQQGLLEPDEILHFMVHYALVLVSEEAYLEYVRGNDTKHIKMQSIITVNNSDAYTQACLAGLGIIQVTQAAAKTHIQHGRLVELLPEYRAAPMPVSMLYPNRRHQPRLVRVFMGWLASRLQDYLG